MDITSAKYTKSGGIVATIDGKEWTLNDPTSRRYKAVVAWGAPEPWVEPVPTPLPIKEQRAAMQLSFAQVLIGLVTEGWITEAEGEAWLAGQLPDAVIAMISTLPAEQRFAAKARAARPSIILRADPLVIAMAGAQEKTPEKLDAFFTTYAAV
ncbi:hypothetical protein [Roseinatronobacter sp.]